MAFMQKQVVEVVYEVAVHLGDNEWGSDLMMRVAAGVMGSPAYAGKEPLVVTVHEHAGWWLQFAMVDGHLTIVGTANDRARFAGPGENFRLRCEKARTESSMRSRRKASSGGRVVMPPAMPRARATRPGRSDSRMGRRRCMTEGARS
jgi:hypothetical protein